MIPERAGRSLRERIRSTLRDYRSVVAPLIVLIVGLGIALASLTPDTEAVYQTSFSGTAGPGNATFSLDPSNAQYVQTNLTVGACDLRVYLATSAEFQLFNSTGQLPSRWIGCSNRATTTTNEVSHLILANDGGASEPYNITVYAFSIGTPYGWLALPGSAIALTGLILFVPRVVLQKTLKLRDEFELKKPK